MTATLAGGAAAFTPFELDALAACAAKITGFSRDAILPEAMRRAAALLLRDGVELPELLQRANAGDAAIHHVLTQAVSVGETYFFRQPDHFRYVAQKLVPELVAQGRKTLRAWSAGCATGEETWSIAACLLDTIPLGVKVEVLGTDLLERNLAVARTGVYGAWSRRPSGPLLHPTFEDPQAARAEVTGRLRAVTHFRVHNLLEAAPVEAPFDLVFCRNVLVYFSPEAVKTAVAHLARAVAPLGALFFGSMDVGEIPPGLSTTSRSELQVYRRLPPGEPRKAPRPGAAPLVTPVSLPRVQRASPEPVALHLRALVHVERGDKAVAARELDSLMKLVPDYLPALLERALLHVRLGEKSAAATLMRELLRRTDKLSGDEVLPGPEPLPVSFYRDSAQTFLRARGGLE